MDATAVNPLANYVMKHTERGACMCGRCVDAPEDPEQEQPEGHTADVFFFKVARAGEPDAETFRTLLEEHKGVHIDGNPLGGDELNYIVLGGWIGDQALALRMMGLGELLGLWKVMTPNLLPGIPDAMKQQMAGRGMVSILPNEKS